MSVETLPNGQNQDATNRPVPAPDVTQPSPNSVTTTPTMAPNTPASPAPSTPQPTGNQPANGPSATPQPTQQKPTQPHPVSRIFDGILKNLSGPVTVTDPVTGERRDVPQSRGTMA